MYWNVLARHGRDRIIVTAVTNAEIPKKFPKGHNVVKTYLRYTPQPNL